MLTENYRNEGDSVSKAPGRREGRPKFYRLITTIEALFFFLFFFSLFQKKTSCNHSGEKGSTLYRNVHDVCSANCDNYSKQNFDF